jgi:RNase P protein component
VVEPWPDCREAAPDQDFGVDLVLIGRDKTRALPFQALREDLRRALGRLGVT